MGLTLKQVDTDCRFYVNSIQRTYLTPEAILSGINAARLEWADRVRWPEIKVPLTISEGDTSVSVSGLTILDRVAVYYGSDNEKNRLHPYDREGKDYVFNASETVEVSLSSEQRPAGYFWNRADKTFELISGSGVFTAPADTEILLYYHGLPSLYTTQPGQENLELEIPTQYCFNIKYYVASCFYQSKDNYKAAATEYAKWNTALLRAEMLFNKSKRDHPKRVKDGLHYARQRYINNY